MKTNNNKLTSIPIKKTKSINSLISTKNLQEILPPKFCYFRKVYCHQLFPKMIDRRWDLTKMTNNTNNLRDITINIKLGFDKNEITNNPIFFITNFLGIR